MKALTQQEKLILKEIQGLPAPLQKKVAGMVKFLKTEFFNGTSDEKEATEHFLSACGKWDDGRSKNEQIRDIYLSRKSPDRAERMF